MDLTLYDDPKEFYRILHTQGLLTHPDNELLLGVLQTLIDDPAMFQTTPYLAAIRDEGTVTLAALITPPWPIVIAAASPTATAYRLLAINLKDNASAVTGVNAPHPLADRFVREWRRQTTYTPSVQRDMKLYRLTEVQPVPTCPGSLIAVDDATRDLAVAWAYEFQQDTRIGDARESVGPHVDGVIYKHNAFLWFDREPVCMAFRERPHATGVSIGYVYTPPQHRRKGYAANLVAEVSRQVLQEGFRYCALFADTKNPTTNHIYQTIGYRFVCNYSYFTFQ